MVSVAVLGATGLVGQRIVQCLLERDFPISSLKLLASKRSAGREVQIKDSLHRIHLAEPDAFNDIDLVLASAGGAASAALIPEAIKRGAVVIDNSSHYRMHPDVPLVVGGVNDEDLLEHQGIIANPNCSTAQLMPVLQALDHAAGLQRVIVSTYQSVSGAGKSGMDSLMTSVRQGTNRIQQDTIPPFSRPIGMNLIPHIDVFIDEPDALDYTKEELKLIQETKKILHRPDLAMTATAVRVPVMVGHSESVTVDLAKPLLAKDAADILRNTPNVVVAKNREDYHTPLETAGTDPVYVSRLRKDTSNPTHGLNMWVVSDNLRIGAALNAVRIAEGLLKHDKIAVPKTHSF